MQQSLAQIFNETAAAAYNAFPQQLARLVVLLVPHADTPVYISPQVADELTNGVSLVGKALEKLTGKKDPSALRDTLEHLTGTDRPTALRNGVKKLAREMREDFAAGIAYRKYNLAGTYVNLIGLDSENILGHFSGRFTQDMQAIFILDHEIGHHILRNGFPSATGGSPQKAELAADAYGMLRHIQRFGKNTDHAGYSAERKAASIVLFSDTEHYTTAAFQQAIRMADERGEDFFKLSLFDTAAMAEKIADACVMDSQRLEKMRTAYLPVVNACNNHLGDPWAIVRKICAEDKDAYALFCRETIAVMRQHKNDADIFTVGKQFLDYPQNRKFMVEAAAAETSGYWKKALAFIDGHDFKTYPQLRSPYDNRDRKI